MGGVPIKAALLRHLMQHPGERLFANDIAESLKESPERVRAGILNLINRDKEPIKIDIRGQAWTYKPNGVPDSIKPMYEFLAVTKNDELVLQGTDGKLLLAREL